MDTLIFALTHPPTMFGLQDIKASLRSDLGWGKEERKEEEREGGREGCWRYQ